MGRYRGFMAYDETLAARVRALLSDHPGFTEKAMFGGIGYMLGGNMAAGVHSDDRLMVRCAKEDHAGFREEAGCGAIQRGGKDMAGWLLIDRAAVESDAELGKWVGRGRAYAGGLPPKAPRPKKVKTPKKG